jgi:hypothetical protein
MREHAHIDTKRREPYLFDTDAMTIMRDAVRLRYSFLPLWYTVFHEASITGLPVMRYAESIIVISFLLGCEGLCGSSFLRMPRRLPSSSST